MASQDPILTAIARLEARLVEHIDARFERHTLELDGRFDAILQRLDRLEVEYQMLKAGMARIEQDVALLKVAYGDLTAVLEDQRVALGDQRLALEDQRAAIARLETEVALVKAAVTRLETEVVEDRADRRHFREEIDALRLRVGDLDTRVKELEARLPAR